MRRAPPPPKPWHTYAPPLCVYAQPTSWWSGCAYMLVYATPASRGGKGVPADAPGGPGLSSKEIKALMLRVDENADGVISYEEFAPLCYELLLQVR